MTKNELKERVYAAIDRRAEEIVRLGERIRKHPELGFKEVKTARLIEETLAGIGLKPKTASRSRACARRRRDGRATGRRSRCSVSSTPSSSPGIPTAIPPPAPPTPAATMRRWPR